MRLNGIDSAEKYFDKVVFFMLNNDEEMVESMSSSYNEDYPLVDTSLLGVFSKSIVNKVELGNIRESYSLVRKSFCFLHSCNGDEDLFKKILFKDISSVVNDQEDPLFKILS